MRLVEAGHILGSASVILSVTDGARERVVVFSGDLGRRGAPILNDPARIEASPDVVFLETTYGDRDHRPLAETVVELAGLVNQAAAQHSKILAPAFAVGRTQNILYHLAGLMRAGEVPTLPVYLDSPLAIAATELYLKYPDLADAEARAVSKKGKLWRGLETLRTCVSAQESRALNTIISTAASTCRARSISKATPTTSPQRTCVPSGGSASSTSASASRRCKTAICARSVGPTPPPRPWPQSSER